MTSGYQRSNAPDEYAGYGEILEELTQENARLRDALDKGRRFERAYQESLGATWTLPQKELLDSLQSAFLDAYLGVLKGGL